MKPRKSSMRDHSQFRSSLPTSDCYNVLIYKSKSKNARAVSGLTNNKRSTNFESEHYCGTFALTQKALSSLKFYFLLIVAISYLIYNMFLNRIFIIMLLFNWPPSWSYDIEHHHSLVRCFFYWNSCFLWSQGLRMNSRNINTEIHLSIGYDCS